MANTALNLTESEDFDLFPTESNPLSISLQEDDFALEHLAGGEDSPHDPFRDEYDVDHAPASDFSHIIAEDITSTSFQLAFDTPLVFGTYDNSPACVLTFIIKPGTPKRGARIKKLKISIHFQDGEKKNRPRMRHPNFPDVRGWFPGGELAGAKAAGGTTDTKGMDCYLGKAHYGVQYERRAVRMSTSGSNTNELETTVLSAELGKVLVAPSRGCLKISSIRSGDNGSLQSNILTFDVVEDKVLKNGVPDVIRLPVLLNYDPRRTFRPIVSVFADMAWKMFSTTKPLVGSKAKDVLLDPKVLVAKAEAGQERRIRACKDGEMLEDVFGSAVETARQNLDHFSGRL